MAQDEKQQKKRLKEAKRTYNKYFKAFKQGKVTKDELKEKLRPYKYELKELGYPVKIKDDDRPKEDKNEEKGEAVKETAVTKIPISYKPWSKRSSMTIEEIERKVDHLSFGSSSDTLKKLYQSRYGEELPPPDDLVPFESGERELPSRKVKGALPAAEDEEGEGGTELVAGEKRSFWKSLVKGRKEEKQEQES